MLYYTSSVRRIFPVLDQDYTYAVLGSFKIKKKLAHFLAQKSLKKKKIGTLFGTQKKYQKLFLVQACAGF